MLLLLVLNDKVRKFNQSQQNEMPHYFLIHLIDLNKIYIMSKQKIGETLGQIITGRYASPKRRLKLEGKYSTMDVEEREGLSRIIRDKYSVFNDWDVRKSLPIRVRKGATNHVKELQHSSIKLNFSTIVQERDESQNNKKTINKKNNNNKKKISHRSIDIAEDQSSSPMKSQMEKLPSIQTKRSHRSSVNKSVQLPVHDQLLMKQSKRERFLKFKSPEPFLKHYINEQNYKPTPEQKHLIEHLLSIHALHQSHIPEEGSQHAASVTKEQELEQMLKKLYSLMNLSVDYNDLWCLTLCTILAADVCYLYREDRRAFYYYNQARIVGTYSKNDCVKVMALFGMGRVLEGLQMFDEAKRVFRKCLQYSWRARLEDYELAVYDVYGKMLYYQGRLAECKFYHIRYAHKISEPKDSALRKISSEILTSHDYHVHTLETANLTTLFLKYLNLPIGSDVAVARKKETQGKIYANYVEGMSPRMLEKIADFGAKSFTSVERQVNNVMEDEWEFKMEMADPDGYDDPTTEFKRYPDPRTTKNGHSPKKQIQFEHSIVHNRLHPKPPPKPSKDLQYKLPIEKQFERMMSEKIEPLWYEEMVVTAKQRQLEQMGNLKQRVRNSHLSYDKYGGERRRNEMWVMEKVGESINAAILNFIDPHNSVAVP